MTLLAFKPFIEKALQLVVLVLVVLLSYQSAQTTLLLLNPLPAQVKGVANSAEQSSVEREVFVDIDAMLDRHIFGELGQVKVQEVKPSDEQAPETKLSLVLQGVSVGFNEESSSAIISEARGSKGEIYWVGDSVLGKATVSSIFDDRVVLKQNGRLETLKFDEDVKSSNQLTRDTRSSRSSEKSIEQSDMLRSYRSRKQEKNNVNRDMARALNGVAVGDFGAFDELLDEYGGDLEKNIEAAARNAGIEVSDEGFRMGNSSQQAWMNRVGLRSTDLVKSINEIPINTLKSDRSAIATVSRSCVARIEVLRGKNTFVLTYPFCK